MSKHTKKGKKLDPKLCPNHLAGRLSDVDDDLSPVIAFVRVIGRASKVSHHCAEDDSIEWLTNEIESRIDAVRTELELVRSQLRKLAAEL